MVQGTPIDPVLFQADIDLANMSTEVIWLRNSAMLAAHSLMIVALGLAPLERLQLTIAVAGMAICLLWLVMTVAGWRYYYQMHERITAVEPSYVFVTTRWGGDVIFICNALLILVFFIIYAIGTWQIARGS
jgi:hypothetical protein